MSRDRIELISAAVFAAILSITAAAVCYANGWILYYGDATAHLNIARRIIDSRTPGYAQIGTAWLPLPHVVMLPFAANLTLWRTGLAGAIPSGVEFCTASVFLFAAVRTLFQSTIAAWVSLTLFAINPNFLYLQATPMTEPLFAAALMALLYYVVRFEKAPLQGYALGAGVACCAATLTRYEGWFLIPFVTVFFFLRGGQKRWRAAFWFAAVASVGPFYWMVHNFWFFGNPLDFYNGPYSAKAIQGDAPYPGLHDWPKAWLYFRTAAEMAVGWPLVLVGMLGAVVCFVRKAFWPVVLLSLPPLFYLISLHSSGNPISVPLLPPHGIYNTRYGLSVLPLLALAAGALATLRWRAVPVLAVAGVLLFWMVRPHPDQWICWKESLENSKARRAWTAAAATYMQKHYERGTGIFTQSGDVIGIYENASIPLRETLNDSNEPAWMAAIARPDLFLNQCWAVAQAGNAVSRAVQSDARYTRVHEISVPGAPVIEIYKRRELPGKAPGGAGNEMARR